MADFVDRAQLHGRAGNGGAGAVSFRREAHVDKGGPDGGDGGDGGSLWLRSTDNLASLISFRDQPFRRAADGAHGSSKKKRGANGRDLVVDVPTGTVVRTLDGVVIADLPAPNISVRVSRGGRGGKGNAGFLSNRRRAPAFAEQGEAGEDLWFNLELKLVADVALVGFPNVGKSSLISVISRAKPKIANYPFTTLIPSLGVVRLGSGDDVSEFVVADIPGLIEGASDGKGLGHEFLRHIERARVLAVVVDVSEFAERPIIEQVEVLSQEMAAHLPSLAERPKVLVANKCDLVEDTSELSAELARAAALIGTEEIVMTSTLAQMNLPEVVSAFSRVLAVAIEQESAEKDAEIVLHRFEPDVDFVIERIDERTFSVEGRDVLRAVRLSDVASIDAMMVIHRRLERMGVIRALRKAGVTEGDEVVIGDLAFVFEDTL